MGKPLHELLAEFQGTSVTGQTKTASAEKPASSKEVELVLEQMGLIDAETVKTASENVSQESKVGGIMDLKAIYEQIVGNGEEQTKVASEEVTPAAQASTNEAGEESALGDLTGQYLNVAMESYFEKIASKLDSAAGAGEQPLSGIRPTSALSAVTGKQADPSMPVNTNASGDQKLEVNGSSVSRYEIDALKKQILKRISGDKMDVGAYA